MRIARLLSRDLVALRTPLSVDKLSAGQLLRLGDSGRAAVLCARGGTILAAVLRGPPALAEGAEAALLPGEVLHAPLGGGALGGCVVDHLGGVLDGAAPSSTPPSVPIFGTPPAQAQLHVHRAANLGRPY